MLRAILVLAILGSFAAPVASAGPHVVVFSAEYGFGVELLGDEYGACVSTAPVGVHPENCAPNPVLRYP